MWGASKAERMMPVAARVSRKARWRAGLQPSARICCAGVGRGGNWQVMARPFSIRCFAGRICQGRGCRTEQNGNIFSSRAGTVQHRSTVQCSTQYIDSYMIALGDRLVTFSELDGTIEVVQRNDMDEVKIEQDPDGEIDRKSTRL